MSEPKRESRAELPEMVVERPKRKVDAAPVKAPEKSRDVLPQDVRAELIQSIVELRKQMDHGLDEAEVKKTTDQLKWKEENLDALNKMFEAAASIHEETSRLTEKMIKREQGMFGLLADIFSPIHMPTAEYEEKQMTRQELLGSLFGGMGTLFLNVRLTSFPGDNGAETILFPALRDAGIQVMINEKLKSLKTPISTDVVMGLFKEADQSPDVPNSKQQLNELYARQERLEAGFMKLITDVEKVMRVKIGRDRYGNMKVDRKQNR